ncbi:IclR family transcriptional regulator [Halobellus captivus]|uniref:IclR family transcriptional regulator n=1 Tax=Halobellus captivus TaxID=2592614 RepID=UPI00139695D2|nr:IclR family transcriptional regulator [Halobellus captivus]
MDGRTGRGNDGPNYVEATQKSIGVLRFLKENGPATLSKIAEETDSAKSTVYRHLRTLEDAGYLVETDDGYRIGQLYLDYGIEAQRSHPLYDAAKPKVDALAEKVGEKVWLVVEENGYAVYLYMQSGEELYRSFTRVGYRGHLHAFSAGKAILAQLSKNEVNAILDRRGLPAYTEETITDRDALFAELDRTRQRGYALHLEEAVDGGNAISVPIQREDGSPIGSICVAGPAHRLNESYLRSELSDLLLGTKNEIELSMRYEA